MSKANKPQDSKINAEIRKLNAEIQKINAEKNKINNESDEIKKRLNAPLISVRILIQVSLTALASVPLIWFYFSNIVKPYTESKKLTIEMLEKQLDTAKTNYQKDSFSLVESQIKFDRMKNNFDSTLSVLSNDFDSLTTILNSYQNLNKADSSFIQNLKKKLNISKLSGYKIGIYYVQGKEEKQIASKLSLSLKTMGLNTQIYDKGEDFFSKVKPPIEYEIRYEKKREKEVALLLKNILEKDFQEISKSFKMKTVRTKTPGFISIFIPSLE